MENRWAGHELGIIAPHALGFSDQHGWNILEGHEETPGSGNVGAISRAARAGCSPLQRPRFTRLVEIQTAPLWHANKPSDGEPGQRCLGAVSATQAAQGAAGYTSRTGKPLFGTEK